MKHMVRYTVNGGGIEARNVVCDAPSRHGAREHILAVLADTHGVPMASIRLIDDEPPAVPQAADLSGAVVPADIKDDTRRLPSRTSRRNRE